MSDVIGRLRELAERATKGPWSVMSAATSRGICDIGNRGLNRRVAIIRDVRRFGRDGNIEPETEEEPIANAAFIAACDPQTILAMAAVCERAKEMREAQKINVRANWCRRLEVEVALDEALSALEAQEPPDANT